MSQPDLDQKFCKAFGRVIIVPENAMSYAAHIAVMQAIPMIFNLPGKKITIEEGGKNYVVRNAGKGIYRVSEAVVKENNDKPAA